MKLTQEEKAKRFDSLQTAIKWTIERYEKQEKEHERYIEDRSHIKVLDAFHIGHANGLRQAIEDMRAWV